MGLKITTDDKGVKIYRNDKTTSNGMSFATYSIMVSTKKGDEYINSFIDVMFPKGTELANKVTINIKDAWFMVSEYKDKRYTKLYVKDFDIMTDGDGFVSAPDDFNINVPAGIDESLPFAPLTR